MITADRNTQLDWISWNYLDEEETVADWIEASIARAQKKAARICRGLGVNLIGVYQFRDRCVDREAAENSAQLGQLSQTLAPGKGTATRAIDLGFPAAHSKQIELRIDIEIDKENKTLKIFDTGLGMDQGEVEKYIAQLAFSGAEDFVKNLK